MIGLDSNVLLRFLAQDDSFHTPKAKHLIERRLTPDEPGFISLVTIAEVAWTLTTTYALSRTEIARVLKDLLSAPNLVLQNEQEGAAAMTALFDGEPFADALIGAVGLWAGCSSTLTFDLKASRLKGFELIP